MEHDLIQTEVEFLTKVVQCEEPCGSCGLQLHPRILTTGAAMNFIIWPRGWGRKLAGDKELKGQ